MEPRRGKPSVDSPGPGPIGGVSAMVGIVGSWTGTGAVSCDEALACKLAGAMLMSQYDKVDDDVLDAMGEIANMVIGNIKTNLESDLGPLQLGVPTVTYGRDFATRSTVKTSWTLVPFECGGDTLFVQVLMTETAELTHHSRLHLRVPA
ncbi:MAG: chemotaxis protein CheX [Bryobacterales bacterium]|nr:chemotaxis protein CheX [Bryobacterales bacterium]